MQDDSIQDEAHPNICIFGNFSATGGIQKSLAHLIEAWTDLGFRVQIVTWRGGVCFYPEEIGHIVCTAYLRTTSKYSTVFSLWNHLTKVRPNVLLSATHLSNLIVSWLDYLPDTGVKRFVRVPNTFSAMHNKAIKDTTRKLSQVRRFYPRTHGVIAVSEGVRQDLVQSCSLDESQVRTIYTPCYTSRILQQAQESVEHPWLERSRDTPVVLSAGRLAEQKDPCTLVDALARVRQNMSCRLIILGEGPLREKIHTRAKEQGVDQALSLPGFTPNPYAWMAKADCFALSSVWEGFGRVLAEALSLGVPLVSTDCPSGPAEILANGKYGKLVPMQNSKALADAILQTLQEGPEQFDPDEASQRFSPEVAAKQYLDYFRL